MKNLFVIGSVTVLIVTSCQNQSEKKTITTSPSVQTTTTSSPPVQTTTTESKPNVTTVITPPPSIPKTNWSIVYQKSKMTLMGKAIPFDDLTTALTDTFTKIAKTGGKLPKSKDFEFKFDEKSGMGVRGEIRSSVDDAREAAMIRTMSTTDKPEIMVQNFYALYTDCLNRTSSPIEKKILNACISDALAKLFAATKNPDADYFLKAQDVGEDWDNTVTVQQVTTAQNKASLSVKMGAQNMKTAVLVDLVKNKNVWVIDKVSAGK
jgi:Protein of unknown function (DUF3828)